MINARKKRRKKFQLNDASVNDFVNQSFTWKSPAIRIYKMDVKKICIFLWFVFQLQGLSSSCGTAVVSCALELLCTLCWNPFWRSIFISIKLDIFKIFPKYPYYRQNCYVKYTLEHFWQYLKVVHFFPYVESVGDDGEMNFLFLRVNLVISMLKLVLNIKWYLLSYFLNVTWALHCWAPSSS